MSRRPAVAALNVAGLDEAGADGGENLRDRKSPGETGDDGRRSDDQHRIEA